MRGFLKRSPFLFVFWLPEVGLEPTTNGLTAGGSILTPELLVAKELMK